MSELQEARDHLALLEACEPIRTRADSAKDAYRAALGGDAGAVEAARQAHEAAALALRDTRQWLRTLARLVRRFDLIAELEGKPITDEQAALLAACRAEVPVLEGLAAPYREAMVAFGADAAGPASADRPGRGDAVVDMPAVAVKARPQTMGG